MLTDERIDSLFSEWLYIAPGRTYEEHRPVARAIESAACAERDARIAELERQLAEARNQALEDAAKMCDDLAELNRKALTDSMWEQEECAAAIRAMKKEQT